MYLSFSQNCHRNIFIWPANAVRASTKPQTHRFVFIRTATKNIRQWFDEKKNDINY